MIRNLDITALRSLMAIADTGGVTRAAGLLNLTQSAVSMQIKRMEEMLGVKLLERMGRQVVLSPHGEQLVSYARKIIALNDEALTRMIGEQHDGVIKLGVPHDIVYPVIPKVLQQFRAQFPGVEVDLQASYSRRLMEGLEHGDYDLILTTEPGVGKGGETLNRAVLSWTGAEGGQVWRQHPVKLAFSRNCGFRPVVQSVLDAAGMAWEMATETDSDRTIEATIAADMAICVAIAGTEPPHMTAIAHGGALPDLPDSLINLYGAAQTQSATVRALAELLRQGFGDLKPSGRAQSGPLLREVG